MKKLTKQDWLKENGFNPFGETYIVQGDSYSIKNELKDAGFKFSHELKWHTSDPSYRLPESCYFQPVVFDDYYIWDKEEQKVFFKEGARLALETLLKPVIPKDIKSTHVGELGGKLTDILVTLVKATSYEGGYGTTNVYIFKDEKDNVFTWFTTSVLSVRENTKGYLTGRVAAHNFFMGEPQTRLIRCSFREL